MKKYSIHPSVRVFVCKADCEPDIPKYPRHEIEQLLWYCWSC